MKKLQKHIPKKKTSNTQNLVTNCCFYGVKWDGISSEILNTVSKAVLNLTELFKSQNVTINSLLSIESNKNEDNK